MRPRTTAVNRPLPERYPQSAGPEMPHAAPPPVLVAVGGLSGSGKSRLAREIAPHLGAAPGARVVRTDAQRKRLAGIGLLDRLPPAGRRLAR